MGWQEDQDRLLAARAADGNRTPAPWNWEIHDASAATLCGGGLDAIVGPIMTVGPCKSCCKDKDDWQWGRCQTPSEEDARLIAAAPDLLDALRNVNQLISEAALTGFNCHDGDWAERLFHSQQATSAAIKRATTPAIPSPVGKGEA